MDPGLKEQALGDLRLASTLISEGRPILGLQVLRIALENVREAQLKAAIAEVVP